MAIVQLWLAQIGNALLSLFIQPFFYVALAAMILLLMYRTKLERKLFSVKLYNKTPVMLKSLGAGIIVTIIISTITGFLGLTVTKETIYFVWAIQIILMLFKFRLLSIVYSAAIIILLRETMALISPLSLPEPLLTGYNMLMNVSSFSLAFIVGLLIVAQSVILRVQGKHFLSPIYISGKRGKVVGGYTLQAFWMIPLFLFVPVEATTKGAIVFDTAVATPLFLELGPAAWILLAFPVMIGSSAITTTLKPEQMIKKMSVSQFSIGIVVLIFVALVWWIPLLIWAVPIILILSYSVQRSIIAASEANHAPIYVNGATGLKILALIGSSTSEQLKLKVGEVISKVNGQEVKSTSDMYDAISLNPAYCKLEVLDENGEVRFVQRTRYADEHHQLGLILVPHEQVPHIKSFRFPSLFRMISPNIVNRKLENITTKVHIDDNNSLNF